MTALRDCRGSIQSRKGVSGVRHLSFVRSAEKTLPEARSAARSYRRFFAIYPSWFWRPGADGEQERAVDGFVAALHNILAKPVAAGWRRWLPRGLLAGRHQELEDRALVVRGGRQCAAVSRGGSSRRCGARTGSMMCSRCRSRAATIVSIIWRQGSLNGGRHHLPSPVAIRLCASVGDAGQNDVEQCGSHPTDEQYQEPEGRLRLYSIAIPHRRLPFQIRDAVQISLSSSEVLRGRRRLPSASDLACRSAAA
jgi:hypothetical protein